MGSRLEQVTKEVTPFTLSLPDIFDLKPAYEIALPASRTAQVYATKTRVDDYDANGKNVPKEKDAWRLVIRTKRGTFISDHSFRQDYAGNVFTDPLLLCLFVQRLVIEYSKKKKITVEETDSDE